MLNPEDVKAELARMQREIYAMGDKVMSLTQICHNQAGLIDRLIDCFERQDHAALGMHLQQLSEHRNKVLKAKALTH